MFFAIGSFCWTDIYAMSVSHYRVTNFILLALAMVGIFISGKGYFMHLFRIKKFSDIDPIADFKGMYKYFKVEYNSANTRK